MRGPDDKQPVAQLRLLAPFGRSAVEAQFRRHRRRIADRGLRGLTKQTFVCI